MFSKAPWDLNLGGFISICLGPFSSVHTVIAFQKLLCVNFLLNWKDKQGFDFLQEYKGKRELPDANYLPTERTYGVNAKIS